MTEIRIRVHVPMDVQRITHAADAGGLDAGGDEVRQDKDAAAPVLLPLQQEKLPPASILR